MYNYLLSSEVTLIFIFDKISGWRFKTTLNIPNDLISLTGCIKEGFILIFSISYNIFAISVGLTDPYNSLFSVASFFTMYSFFWIFSCIDFASFFSLDLFWKVQF